jgi:hypothetical protein
VKLSIDIFSVIDIVLLIVSQPKQKVLPFDVDLGVSSTIFVSYLSGPGFYLALRKITAEIGFLFHLPKVQLFEFREEGI